MTSTSRIEKEIVQMYFDAKDFQRGVKNSIDSMRELKRSMDMKNSTKAFEDLEKASKVDFHPLEKGLGSVTAKIGVMQIAAATLIANITQGVIDGAKKMFDALVLAPITTGLEEYETQLNAVQTILANTKKHGTTLKDVTKALDELNLYADLTIYNFTQMTDSIGKFTTAGVDLDTSVAAIKGIANLAALSGSNAQQAATGMYQLSQAISTGVVKLMDWNSVVNAGMGGQIFQDALMETARVHGVAVDTIIAEEGSFRDSLQRGWLSSDILLETLSKFTGDLTESQLEAMGYTQEQIANIVELGETANDAATKIKTLTALKDTMAEALQSGWSETWRIVFGDFEEAKELWGNIAAVFDDIIGGSADARNALLGVWKDVGGRDIAIEGLFDLFRFGRRILSNFGAALTDVFDPITWRDLLRLTIAFRDFAKGLASNYSLTNNFRRIVRGLASVFKILSLVIRAVLAPLQFLSPLLKVNAKGFLWMLGNIGDAIYYFSEFAEKTDYFGKIVRNIIRYLKLFGIYVYYITKALYNTPAVQNFVDKIKQIRLPVITAEMVLEKLRVVATAIVGPFYLLAVAIRDLYNEFIKLKIIQPITEWFNSIDWQATADYFLQMRDNIGEFFNEVKQAPLLQKFLTLLKTFDGRRFNEFVDEGKNNFQWLIDIGAKLKEAILGIDVDLAGIWDGVKKIAGTIGGALEDILDYLIDNAAEIDYEQLFDVINAGLLTGILVSVKKIASGDFLEDIFGEDSFFGEIMQDSFDRLEGTLVSFQNNIRADTLQKIAVAIALLAGSITLMTLIDETRLAQSSAAITLMVASLFGSAGVLKTIKTQDALKSAAAIVGLAVAVSIFAVSLKLIENMDGEDIRNSLAGLSLGIASLAGVLVGLSKKGVTGAGWAKTTAFMIGMATSLLLFAQVVEKFGSLDLATLAKGLTAAALALGMMTFALIKMNEGAGQSKLKSSLAILGIANALLLLTDAVIVFGEMDLDVLSQGLLVIGAVLLGLAEFSKMLQTSGLIQAAVSMVIIGGALYILAGAIKIFSMFSWDEITTGLLGIAGVLLILAVAGKFMVDALPAAVAIAIMAGALVLLAGAIKLLSTLTWQQLGVALAAIAGVLIILGVAGVVLAPVVPILIGLALALTLLGVGALALGAGLLLAALGLVAVAGAAVPISIAIREIGDALSETLPKIGEGIAEGLTSFITTLASKQPEIVAGFVAIGAGIIEGFTTLIPLIVSSIWDLIIAIGTYLEENVAEIVSIGYGILTEILNGIADNIGEAVTAGLNILTEIINGIADGIPDLIDAAFNLLLEFLGAIEDAIDEYYADILKAGARIGQAIVEGLVEAIGDGIEAINAAVLALAKSAWDTIVAWFDNRSPSHKMYGLGQDVVQGFVNAIYDGQKAVSESMALFGYKAQQGLSPMLAGISADIEQGVEFNPVIRPVLVLDDITSGLNRIDTSFRNARVLAELSYSGSIVGRTTTEEADSSQTKSGQIQFNQYNYSPKALSREDIYRQTKTQIAKFELRALEI